MNLIVLSWKNIIKIIVYFIFLHIHALFIIIILFCFVLRFVVICLSPNKIYKNSLNLFTYTHIA